MNEPQLLKSLREQEPNLNKPMEQVSDLPAESIDYEPVELSSYEQEHGVPYIVEKLKLHTPFRLDNKISTMARGVDEYLLQKMEEEGLRDGATGYETILERMLSRFPDSLERVIQKKEGGKVLDFLFREAALSERLSTDTYLKIVDERMKYKRVENLTNQLKSLLNTI